jgi:tol-pal system protein YbgF
MRSKAAIRLVILASLGTVLAACATAPEEDPVMIRLNDLDQRLERLERVLSNQSLLELAQQLQTVQTETRALRGELEELQHGADNTRRQQRDLYADLDNRLKAVEVGAAPIAAAESASNVGLPVPAGSDRANYQAAFDLLKAGQYDKATASFQQFLVTFPDSALADNAQYWLGETYYVTRDFPQALKAFRRVVDNWPESRKLADSWLKIGYCHYELKSWGPAREALNRVVREYKDTGAATEAAKRLERMKAEGH